MVANREKKLRDEASGLFQQDELPERFTFVEELSPLHQRLFFVELWQATAQHQMTQSPEALQALVVLIEGWEATASVDSDPDLAAALRSKKRYQPLRIV